MASPWRCDVGAYVATSWLGVHDGSLRAIPGADRRGNTQ